MAGEQVKYARHLCTTCHSVIKAVAVLLSLSCPVCSRLHSHFFFLNEYGAYTMRLEKNLRRTLAEELPTLNVHKTCALAISCRTCIVACCVSHRISEGENYLSTCLPFLTFFTGNMRLSLSCSPSCTKVSPCLLHLKRLIRLQSQQN